jgi:hypothetical protein
VLPDDAFPDLTAFRSSHWWEMFGASGDTERLVRELRALPEKLSQTRAMLADEGLDGERPPPAASIADLVPYVPPERRPFHAMVPALVAALEPLWSRDAWSEDEVALAKEVGKFLHAEVGAPEETFAAGAPGNAASLRRLAAWFRGEVGRVERYAAMTLTLDDGPFVGVPVAALPEGPPVVCPLRGALRVEAWTEGPDAAAVFAGRRGAETLWCRRITQKEGTPHTGVRVDPLSADDLAAYGWVVHFSAGGEHAHLYVGPDGRFLFYFVSW